LQNEVITSNLYIEDFIFNKIKYHDSLAYHFFKCLDDTQLYAKTSALESIKSNGLNIISNDSLRLAITGFFQILIKDVSDHGRITKGLTNFRSKLAPYLEHHFKIIDLPIKDDGGWYNEYNTHPPKQWEVIDIAALQEDTKLHLALNQTFMRRQGVTAVYNSVKAEGIKLLDFINSEIERLE
jgi:hypothetical protein